MISDALSRAPVGGPEGIENVLNRLRGQASYVNNRIISSVNGDVSPEVLEDLALDKMWEEAMEDTGYQAVAKVVADKVPKKTVLKMSKHPIKEYQSNMEMLSVIEKKGIMKLLMNYTRIVVPEGISRERVLG